MSTPQVKRVADTACATCGKNAPVVEHTYIQTYSQNWTDRTVTTVDREVHCDGHMTVTRSVRVTS